MAVSGGVKLARWLGIATLVLAWTAAAIEYSKSGEIRWALIAAGVFFATMPFAGGGNKPSA